MQTFPTTATVRGIFVMLFAVTHQKNIKKSETTTFTHGKINFSKLSQFTRAVSQMFAFIFSAFSCFVVQ